MLRGTTERTVTQPAPSPVSLEPRYEPLPIAVHTFGALVCVGVFWLAWQGLVASLDVGYGYRLNAKQVGSALASSGLVVGGGWGAWKLWHSFIAEIEDVRQRRREWHEQLLWERQQQGGMIVEQERTDFTLRSNNLEDVLVVAMYCYMQVRSGKRWPWSIDNLKGSLYLSDNAQNAHKARLLGYVSEYEARKLGEELARLGLVRGRADRSAGEWVATTADDVLDIIMRGMR